MEKITLQEFSDCIAERIKEQYNTLGLPASRRFEKELEPTAEDGPFRKHAIVYGSAYSGALISGRTKNTNQTPEGIRAFVGWAGNTWAKQWVEDKGLDISPFAVAYKIARQGIRVPNENNDGRLISEVITAQSIVGLLEKMGAYIITDIKTDIQKTWQQ